MLTSLSQFLKVLFIGFINLFCFCAPQIFFGTFHGKMYLTANFLGINCASGMSTLFRKEIIDAAGGLAAFGKYLAEDYLLAQAVLDRGYKVRLCGQVASQNSGNYSFDSFQDRLVRWVGFSASIHSVDRCFAFISSDYKRICLWKWDERLLKDSSSGTGYMETRLWQLLCRLCRFLLLIIQRHMWKLEDVHNIGDRISWVCY